MIPQPPRWALQAEKVLQEAAARIRVIFATTPVDLASELERLGACWAIGDECLPRFTYRPALDHGVVVQQLSQLASWLQSEGPLGRVYADRACELVDEAQICAAVGNRGFRVFAAKRFGRRDHFDDLADELANDWLQQPAEEEPTSPTEWVFSDDPLNPSSLLVRMRSELGVRKLPFRVVVVQDSAALAATGEGFVQIARGRRMTLADVERTVLHEVEGHVLPRFRADSLPLKIFALGTKFGVDDQEGRALMIERRAGMLGSRRRRELALRHVAARQLDRGADFVQVVRLLRGFGAPSSDALRIAARVLRGGGLGREIVYLPAFLRIDASLAADPTLDVVLGVGRVSIDAVSVLKPWVE